jgi:hypothetical protein
MATLKEIFDRQFSEVKFDRMMCQRIIQYSNRFMTRNDDHAAFFGGALLGVHPVRFLDSDRDYWYDMVLDVDETLLEKDFENASAINHDFKVSGDVFNYTPVYVVYRLNQEKGLSSQLRKEAQKHCFMVLHYRFLTSLLVPRFRYLADPEIAQALYASLNRRFDLKRYGSWKALLEARSEDLLVNRIYQGVLQEFEDEPMIIRTVTDTQGRIRELVKTLYDEYIKLKEAGTRHKSVSATTINMDGDTVLRDRRGGFSSYIRYMDQVCRNERSLIRQELVDVIASAMHTMPPQLLKETLTVLSANYGRGGKYRYLEEMVKETQLYCFDYLVRNRRLLDDTNDIAGILASLKNLLTASRSVDPTVLKLRKQMEMLVRDSVKTRNNAVVASVRTAALLYLILRSLTKNHYG